MAPSTSCETVSYSINVRVGLRVVFTSEADSSLCSGQLPESVAGGGGGGGPAQAPSEVELEAYGVSLDFRDFIRSLTYGTFRCCFELLTLTRISVAGSGRTPSGRTPCWRYSHSLPLAVLRLKVVGWCVGGAPSSPPYIYPPLTLVNDYLYDDLQRLKLLF